MSRPEFSNSLALTGRLLMAVIFIVSGLAKIAMPAATLGYISSIGAPAPILGYAIAVIVEVVGAALIVIGYQTRFTSIVIALYCLATALMFHNNFGDRMEMINFLKNICMAGGFLQLSAFGAGAFSLDGRLGGVRILKNALFQRRRISARRSG